MWTDIEVFKRVFKSNVIWFKQSYETRVTGKVRAKKNRADSDIMLAFTNFSIPIKGDDHKGASTQHFAEIVHHRATLVRLSGRSIWV